MKFLLPRMLRGLTVLAFALGCGSRMYAEGCPAHSHPVRTEDGGNKVICRCDEGYTKFHGGCENTTKVRAALEQRHRDALNAMNSSLQSFANDLIAAGLTGLGNDFKSLIPGVTAAAVAPNARLATMSFAELVKVTTALDKGAEDVKSCSFSQTDLRTDCLNAKNFRDMANETLQQLQALDKKP